MPLNEVIRLPELSSAWTVRPKPLPAVTLAGGCCGHHQVVQVRVDADAVDLIGEPEVAVGARRDPERSAGRPGTAYSVMAWVVGLIIPELRRCR